MEALPCGCIISQEGDTVIFQPHANDCEWYLFFLEEAARQGKNPEIIEIG